MLLTITDTAKRLNVSPATVRHLIERGKLVAVAISDNRRRVTEASILAFAGQAPAVEPEPVEDDYLYLDRCAKPGGLAAEARRLAAIDALRTARAAMTATQ